MNSAKLDSFLEKQFNSEYAVLVKEAIKKEKLEEIKNKHAVSKKITLSSTGNEIEGTSTKLRNICKIKQADLIASLAGFGLLIFVNNTVAFLLTLLNLIMNTLKDLTLVLTKREARVLYAIYLLKEHLTRDRIYSKYQEIFGEIDEYQIILSLRVLEELNVLEKNDLFSYKLSEKISIKYK